MLLGAVVAAIVSLTDYLWSRLPITWKIVEFSRLPGCGEALSLANVGMRRLQKIGCSLGAVAALRLLSSIIFPMQISAHEELAVAMANDDRRNFD